MEVRLDSLSAPAASRDVRRREIYALERPQKTREGFLRAEGLVGKPGIVQYVRPDGTVRREYRAPEAVFDEESLSSFALLPVTLGHPKKLLTPETVAEHQVGSIGTPTKIGDKLKAPIFVSHKDAISAVERGMTGLSLGYGAKVEETPGTLIHDDGTEERFDAVQVKIVGNHLAICRPGDQRAGDDIKIRMDSLDVIDEAEPDTTEGTTHMELENVEINGKTYRLPKDEAARFRADSASHQSSTQLEELRGKNAALEAQLAQSKEQRMDSKDLHERVQARLELVSKASGILGKAPADFAALTDVEVMREAAQKECPHVRMDSVSEDFVRGVFSSIPERVDTTKRMAQAMSPAASGKKPVASAERMDSVEGQRRQTAESRRAMIAYDSELWKPASLVAAEKAAREHAKA